MLHVHAEHQSLRLKTPVVDWGAVWSGALVGAGVMTMVSALWLALGFGSGVSTFHNGIEWWLAATGIGSVLIGGFVAGSTSTAAGPGWGTTNSLVMWALLAIPTAFVAVIVAAANHATASSAVSVLERVGSQSLWAAWWSMLIGLGTALLGGLIGGAVRGYSVSTAEPERDHPVDSWAYPTGTPGGAGQRGGSQLRVRD